MNSIDLILSSLEIQRTLKGQSILQVFLLWKETTHKPSKVATAKKRFLHCFYYWCFDMLFVPCDNWKTLKRDSNTCFPVNIVKFLRTALFKEHLR